MTPVAQHQGLSALGGRPFDMVDRFDEQHVRVVGAFGRFADRSHLFRVQQGEPSGCLIDWVELVVSRRAARVHLAQQHDVAHRAQTHAEHRAAGPGQSVNDPNLSHRFATRNENFTARIAVASVHVLRQPLEGLNFSFALQYLRVCLFAALGAAGAACLFCTAFAAGSSGERPWQNKRKQPASCTGSNTPSSLRPAIICGV